MKINLGYIPKRIFNQKEIECLQQQKNNSEPIILDSNLSIMNADILFKRLGFELIEKKEEQLTDNTVEKEYRYQGLSGAINVIFKFKTNEPNKIIIKEIHNSNEIQYKKVIKQLVDKLKNTQ